MAEVSDINVADKNALFSDRHQWIVTFQDVTLKRAYCRRWMTSS